MLEYALFLGELMTGRNHVEVSDHFRGKLRDVGVIVGTVLADNVLLACWLIVEYCMEQYVFPRFLVSSIIAKISFWVFRIIFAVSTLVPTVVILYKDLRIIWIRSSATIKAESKALTATSERKS